MKYKNVRWVIFFNNGDKVVSDPLENEGTPLDGTGMEEVKRMVKDVIGTASEGTFSFPINGDMTIVRSSQIRMITITKNEVKE